jgi:hypothetical protein
MVQETLLYLIGNEEVLFAVSYSPITFCWYALGQLVVLFLNILFLYL